jgi:hypothetical protein
MLAKEGAEGTLQTDEHRDLWTHLVRIADAFHFHCEAEGCAPRVECIEHCRDGEEETDMLEDAIDPREEVQPSAYAVNKIDSTGDKLLLANHWGNGSGKAASDQGKTQQPYVRLFATGQQGDVFRPLPPPPFRKGLPMKAYLYRADPADDTDVALERCLRSLSGEARNVLTLRRVQTGQYEIDGRPVQIYSSDAAGSEYLVHEENVEAGGHGEITDMNLGAYINLVSTVAMSLFRPGVSPTFVGVPASSRTSAVGDDCDDRCRAMKLACIQAELRSVASMRETVS